MAAAALPAAASAHGQHHRRHARAHAHIQSFGPTSPVAPAGESAGTVTSFTAGVLTIKLGDGTSVTGKVTPTTELKCESAAPASTTTAQTADYNAGDGHGAPAWSQGQSAPETTTTGAQPGEDGGQDVGEADDHQGTPPGAGETCDATSLIPGAVIRQAELSVGSAGASFVEVKIVR